ncbi:MAG: hypothetical protein AAFY41_17305, partial [Bacteroidota bacterium]
ESSTGGRLMLREATGGTHMRATGSNPAGNQLHIYNHDAGATQHAIANLRAYAPAGDAFISYQANLQWGGNNPAVANQHKWVSGIDKSDGGKFKIANIDPTATWSDYVFDEDYELKPLKQVASFIKVHQHLPEVPSAKEVAEKGYQQTEIKATLPKKIEELTFYLIQFEERMGDLNQKNENQEKEVVQLKAKLN